MKHISKWYIACLAMAFSCFVAACSEEELDSAQVTLASPDAYDTARLDTCDSFVASFELEASGFWQLYSDRTWVKFSLQSDGEFFNDVQGNTGSYTVYVKVTNDGRGFDESQAVVSLVSGGETENVLTIVRKGKNTDFALSSDGGEKLDSIEIGYDASVWVSVAANFECSVLSCPAWISEPEALSGGFTFSVAEEFLPYEKEGEVTFGNIDGSIVYKVPVHYSGMNPAILKIEGDNTPWGWEVSLDGKTFVQETTTSTDESTEKVVENALVYSVTCLDYNCKFVAVQVNDGKLSLMDESAAWIIASQDDNELSKVSVTISPSSERSRSGYLFAVPAAMYREFADSLAASSDADTFIDSNQSFVVVEILQKDLAGSDGFVVTDSNGAAVSCVAEVEYYEFISSEFTITDVTACSLEPGKVYTIETKLSSAEWQGNYTIADIEHNQLRLKLWSPTGDSKGPQPVLAADGTYKMEIMVPASLNKIAVLRLYDPNIVNIKALVIRPVTNEN